jgi:hypothetical protein
MVLMGRPLLGNALAAQSAASLIASRVTKQAAASTNMFQLHAEADAGEMSRPRGHLDTRHPTSSVVLRTADSSAGGSHGEHSRSIQYAHQPEQFQHPASVAATLVRAGVIRAYHSRASV